MPDTVILKLKRDCSAGTYTPKEIIFGTGNFLQRPLVTRRIANERQIDQGYGPRRVNIIIRGFIEGNSHFEIMTAYQELQDLLSTNDLMLNYSVNGMTILENQRVYLDTGNEPEAWKQYVGDYEINLYYFESVCYDNSTSTGLGIVASYTSSLGTHTFSPVPNWESRTTPTKSHWNEPWLPCYTDGGQNRKGRDIVITLTGFLVANNHDELVAKKTSLDNAFKDDGTLVYGSWSNEVKIVEPPVYPTTFPRNKLRYVAKVAYNDSNIHFIKTRISHTRIHRFPLIRDRRYCRTTEVKTFHESGQYVTYNIHARCNTTALTRNFLKNEVACVVSSGSTELPGGTEAWEDDQSVKITINKFFYPAIIVNIEDIEVPA